MAVHRYGADINVYAYVHAAVLRAVDPNGLTDEGLAAGADRAARPVEEKRSERFNLTVAAVMTKAANNAVEIVRDSIMSVNGGGELNGAEVGSNKGRTPLAATALNAAILVLPAPRVIEMVAIELKAAMPEIKALVARTMATPVEKKAADLALEQGGKWLTRDAIGTAFSKGVYSTPYTVLSQCTETSCTAASARSLLQDRGIVLGEEEVAKALGTTPSGTLLKDAPSGLAKLGIEGVQFQEK